LADDNSSTNDASINLIRFSIWLGWLMQVFLIIMQLVNGELAKVPVSLALKHASCSKAFEQVVQQSDTAITFNNKAVGAYYCKKGTGEWVQ
jgi:hypothetical protein